MSMFEKYDNLVEGYIPNNKISAEETTYSTVDTTLPNKEYNALGKFIGYSWSYGDVFDLHYSINKTIPVSSKSLVYEETGAKPTSSTKGFAGQQAYNTVDCLSWTCVGISNNMYVWIQDDELLYPRSGDTSITLTPEVSNIELVVDLYNFRWEHIHTFSNSGQSDIYCEIDKELSERMKPGIYYGIFKVSEGSSSREIGRAHV